ncbi:MAG: type VI secretion system-associated protein TagF, partial [Mesorhizobium sp.]
AYSDAWFDRIEEAAFAAQRGELTPDELDAALGALPAPAVDEDGDVIDDLVMWTARTDIFDVDPQAPQKTVERIFAASWETS